MVNSVFQTLYVFLQLFMIFKFSNVIVNRSKRLARLAFMHCIASAILFWISAIINETMDNILQSAYDGSELDILDNTTKGKNDIIFYAAHVILLLWAQISSFFVFEHSEGWTHNLMRITK